MYSALQIGGFFLTIPYWHLFVVPRFQSSQEFRIGGKTL